MRIEDNDIVRVGPLVITRVFDELILDIGGVLQTTMKDHMQFAGLVLAFVAVCGNVEETAIGHAVRGWIVIVDKFALIKFNELSAQRSRVLRA